MSCVSFIARCRWRWNLGGLFHSHTERIRVRAGQRTARVIWLQSKNKTVADNKKILIGKIVAPQGIRGEVRVHTYTAAPDDLRSLKILDLPIKFVRAAGRDIAICRVDGITDRTAAEALRGTELFISRDALPAVTDGEYYQADLIGFDVVRAGASLGRVACFQNFGAGDIIELNNGDMVSFIGADVDMENKKVKVR